MLKKISVVFLFCLISKFTLSQKAGSPPPGVVIDKSNNPQHVFFGSPSIVILPNGNYVASHDYFGGGTFQYVDWQFDGKDIIAGIRTAWGNANTYHNANYLTFMRINNFRHLKMKDSPPDLFKNDNN